MIIQEKKEEEIYVNKNIISIPQIYSNDKWSHEHTRPNEMDIHAVIQLHYHMYCARNDVHNRSRLRLMVFYLA